MIRESRTDPQTDLRPGGLRRRRRRRTVLLLMAVDALAIASAGLLASALRFGTVLDSVAGQGFGLDMRFWELALVFVPPGLLLLGATGLYDMDRQTWRLTDVGKIVRALSLGVVLFIVATYLAKAPGLSRGWVILTWLFAIIFVVVGRGLVSLGSSIARQRGHGARSMLLVGSNAEGARLMRAVEHDSAAGLVPVGYLRSTSDGVADTQIPSVTRVPALGEAHDIRSVLASSSIDTVVIASSAFDHDTLARMIADLGGADVDLHISSGLFEVLTSRIIVNEIAGVPLITVKGLSLSPIDRLTKRIVDLVVASAVIILGAPLWLILALAIRLVDGGPVLYRQTRIGRGGTPFPMLKFRSMYVDADERLESLRTLNEASGPLFKIRNDPRITPIGRILRKYSIDEFPQLINVVRGEMSLVGPRPPLPCETECYADRDWRRLEVVPGMTGLWQVSGRSSLTFDEMVRLDLFYIENWSVALDLSLIVRTIPTVLLAKGAY